MSCAVTRTRLPDLRTLPSSTVATLSLAAMPGCRVLPLKLKEEVRGATRRPRIFAMTLSSSWRGVGEVLVLLVAAQVHEGQHGDRALSAAAGGKRARAASPRRDRVLREQQAHSLGERFRSLARQARPLHVAELGRHARTRLGSAVDDHGKQEGLVVAIRWSGRRELPLEAEVAFAARLGVPDTTARRARTP